MRKLALETPPDLASSPITGWTRRHWEEVFHALMKGIVDSASEGGARQRIPGPRSHHGLLADELEGFTRSMIMAGPWLDGSPEGTYQWQGSTVDVAGFYRKGILAGTNPKHPEYWGDIVDYAQHLVEMAALAWGLYLSRRLIWDRLGAGEKRQIADYMLQCNRVKYHQNNWLLFNVVTNAVLKRLDMPYSQEHIDANLQACEHMYIGDGWYRDGKINRIDYYNAWAFLYYYLQWTILDGDSKPELAERHKDRARQFVGDLRYFFSGDGGPPCFGRSMIYRFGMVSPVALGQYLGCLDITPGEARTMCSGVLKFFFSHEILTDSGHLSMGFLRPCAEMLEHYSCGGSPYWATKAFNVLMIPADNPFWKAEEAPLPIHQASYSKPLPSAGLLLIGDQRSGHVQLINQKSYHDKPEYSDKYTKFAYSSVFSYEARPIFKNLNCDNVLQFSEDGINFRQRWEMENLHCVTDFAASRYPLHEVDPAGTIHSSTLVKDDFMINLHHVETTKALVFKEGGYPLGFDEGEPKIVSTAGGEAAYKDGKVTFMRNLAGYSHQHRAQPFGDDINGTNVRYRRSVVPSLSHENGRTVKFQLASMVCGRIGSDSIDSLMKLVTAFELRDGAATITFHDGERAFVQIGPGKDVEVALNGKRVSGPIVLARVSASGQAWFVLRRDGTIDQHGWSKGAA
jgi:hypothetical protein